MATTTRKAGSPRRRRTRADWQKTKALLAVVDEWSQRTVDVVRAGRKAGATEAQILRRVEAVGDDMVRRLNEIDPTYLQDIERKERQER